VKLPEPITIRDGRRCTIDHVMPSGAERYRAYLLGLAAESAYITTQTHEVKSVEKLADQAQLFLDMPGHVWLAVFDESKETQIADCMARITLRDKMSHVAMIGVGVLQGYRGQGIGRLLMERIVDWAIEQPTILKLELNMFAQNTPAQRLYESLGFEIEGRCARSFRQPDGTLHDKILMGRWLGDSGRGLDV